MSPTHAIPASTARERTKRPLRFAVVAGLASAVLVAIASLAGVLLPGTYARETASLASQGVGQDWVNLLVIVPLLCGAALGAHAGSRRARLLLAGALAYTIYSYAIYAFGIHFNSMFLVYCAALGFASFGLASLAGDALRADVRNWYEPPVPRRLAGWLQIAIAFVFAALWLAEIVPALARGEVPASVAREKLLTNPVHVLDLALALPALVVGGIAILRDRPLGYFLAPVLLALGTLMAIAIGGMVVAVFARGVTTDLTVAGVFAVVAVACAAALGRLLARVRPQPS